MKFTANRKVMLEYLKSMIRVIPKTGPIQELKGFLIEANEDDGFLYLTANNLEAAIQRKFKPQVETGGSFVMEAKILTDILSLLGEDIVVFEEIKPGTIMIKSGFCTYTMRVLDGKIFPRPEIPFPNTTVHICGMKQFYTKTYATTGKKSAQQSLEGIHFSIKRYGITAISCNVQNIAVATKKLSCGGNLEFTLPKESVSYLAAAAGDDELEVGLSGSSIVFMKEGLLFSARPLTHEFVNVDMVLKNLKTAYISSAEFDGFKEQVLNTCEIASMGSETSYLQMDFEENEIIISTKNDVGSGRYSVPVIMTDGEAGKTYYYSVQQFKDSFKTVDGTLVLRLDIRGYLVVMDGENQFFLTPIREATVQKQLEKYEEKKKKAKKDTKKQPGLQAA